MRHLYSHRKPKPTKTVGIVRYGALGDAMQMTSILPWLSEQGYHITVYTTPDLKEVLRNDPHIDEFVVQDIDAIQNEDLGKFWDAMKKKHTKWVNLSESVERTLLPMRWNMAFHWPHSMRHKYLNKNYMEFVHDIAEVPLPSRIKFYPTREEREWAMAEYAKIGGYVIVWVLSGSGVHKTWPHTDAAMMQILGNNPETRIVLVGGKDEAPLQGGWENEPRVHLRCGKWSVRQSLAFAQAADLLVGPETGVTNALSMESIPKVVILSHSSVENLTRDWVNTISVHSSRTACYPCHQLHMVQEGYTTCREAPQMKGIAACQHDIPAGSVANAIQAILNQRRKAA